MNSIGKRLKELRKGSGRSQSEVAHELSISQGAYSQIENGNYSLSLSQAVTLSKLYNSSVEWIASGKQQYGNGSSFGLIPLVSSKDHSTYLQHGIAFLQSEAPYYRLPGFTDADYVIFEVGGYRMRPALIPQDYLVCFKSDDIQLLVDGTLCIAVTDSILHFGRLYHHDDKITVKYDNSTLFEQDIPVSAIQELWIGLAKLTSVFFSPDADSELKFQRLEERLARIEKNLGADRQ